jgi:hypothetical protein
MLGARKPEANNCDQQCLFCTSGLSGAAERTADWVLWAALLTGAEEPGIFQTIWVCLLEVVAIFVESLTFPRLCMIVNNIQ